VTGLVYSALVERKGDSALVVSQLWTDLTAKYGSIDRVEISGYETLKSDGVHDTKATILNLNVTKALARLAEYRKAKEEMERAFSDVKAMLKKAVDVEVIGFKAGARGRKSTKMSVEAQLEVARQALAAK
jgi:ferredoxin-fold anticodon binding domain-containing protein